MKLRSFTVLMALLLGVVAIACSGTGNNTTPDATTGTSSANATASPGSPAVTGSITVFAAASLTDSFKEVAAAFEAANPGVDVTFNFAGSSALRAQLEQGAPADVFASADTDQMASALENGTVVGASKIFVHNSPVIITPKDNPAGINSLADLKKPDIKLVLAAPEVPIGNYSRQLLTNADKDATYGAGFSDAVLKNLVSNEANVKDVVAKVQLGEADAGIVYGTDITPSVASALDKIDVPASVNVVADYPIAVTKDARNADAARAFVNFVTSTAGQTILKKWGFQTI